MFARGWACLHTAQLPVPKHSAAKPCISITSKLTESKRLQYFKSFILVTYEKQGGGGVTDWYTWLIFTCENPTEVSSIIPAHTSLFPASPIIPAHARYPGGGGHFLVQPSSIT